MDYKKSNFDECTACTHIRLCKYSKTYMEDIRELKKTNDHHESVTTIMTVSCKLFEERTKDTLLTYDRNHGYKIESIRPSEDKCYFDKNILRWRTSRSINKRERVIDVISFLLCAWAICLLLLSIWRA